MTGETATKPSLLDFIRYLRRHIYELADNQYSIYTEEKKQKLEKLSNTLTILEEFAEDVGDKELGIILDDFTYAVNESIMGAALKGKSEMDRFAFRLDEYEKLLNSK